MGDLHVAVDVLAIEEHAVIVALFEALGLAEIAEPGIVHDADERRLQVGQRRLVAEAELLERATQLRHHLVDTGGDVLPALRQEEIRVAAEELQIVLEDAVAVHKFFRPPAEMLIGFDAGPIAHLDQELMRQVEHLLAAWCRDQRVLVLRKGTAVGLVERIADRQAQNVRPRQMQTQLAPQLARFLEREGADQVERQRRSGEGRNDVSSEVFLEPGDLVSDGHFENPCDEWHAKPCSAARRKAIRSEEGERQGSGCGRGGRQLRQAIETILAASLRATETETEQTLNG